MTLLRPKSGIYFGGVYFFHSLLTPLHSLCLLYFPFLYRSLSLRHLAAPLNQIMGLGSAVHSSSGVRPGRKRIFGVFRAQETRLVAAFYWKLWKLKQSCLSCILFDLKIYFGCVPTSETTHSCDPGHRHTQVYVTSQRSGCCGESGIQAGVIYDDVTGHVTRRKDDNILFICAMTVSSAHVCHVSLLRYTVNLHV